MKKLESSLVNMVVVLTVIAVIAGGALAYVNSVTKEPIANIMQQKLQDGIKQVILGSTEGDLIVENPDTINEQTIVYRTDKGVAVKTTSNAFGGPMEILVGFDKEGIIMGYTILSTKETPGLGVKADTWFQAGQKGDIIGKNPGVKPLSVSKDGGEVDAITASTITSRAFLNAVNDAFVAFTTPVNTDVQSGASKLDSSWEDNSSTKSSQCNDN